MLATSSERKIGSELYYKDFQIRANPGVHDAVMEAIKTYLRDGARVLDLGAGSGAFALRLHESGFNVTAAGIDANDFTIKDVPFQLLDITEELVESHIEQFDAVISIEVIEHLENIFDSLRKIYTMLKPQGLAFITTPNILSIRSRLLFWHSGNFAHFSPALVKDWGHIQILPAWLLLFAAHKAGFQCEKIIGVGNIRDDLVPRWHLVVVWVARQIKRLFCREKFPGEFSRSQILLVLKKVEANELRIGGDTVIQ